MEVGLSLNQLVRLPLSSSTKEDSIIIRHSLIFSTMKIQSTAHKPYYYYYQKQHGLTVIEAKGKKGTSAKQYQRSPPIPKLEDDGNPKFVIFIRMANVDLWYPLNIVTGGATAKIIVSAKDTFFGKFIYKDTLAKNIGAVIYRDEKEMQKMAQKQFRVLRSATEFKYGYKLIENNNVRAALAANDVIESDFGRRLLKPSESYTCPPCLPSQDELKPVVDKVKDFFGDAKESFGKISILNPESESSEEVDKVDSREKST